MHRPLVKICGISTRAALDTAVAAGADLVGFVHYAPSPRNVSLAEARSLRNSLPAHVRAVLLLVNVEARDIAAAVDAARPDIVQLHGAETPHRCAQLRQDLPVEIWKAIGVRDSASLAESQRFVGAVDRLLYDAPAGRLPGGNGLALDWSLLSGFDHRADWGLAGGLTPANVAEAVRQTGAPLVDTSSGVESKPGVKDVDKIRAFCQAARDV